MSRKVEDGWFKKQITVGNMLSVATVAFAFAGFYFTTTSTLTAQGTAIAGIERKITESDKKDEKQQAAVAVERQTLRTEMTDRAEKAASGLAELNKQNAVLSTQLLAIRDDIVRLSAQIANLGGGPAARK